MVTFANYDNYKEHWACFHCRKMVRRPSWHQLWRQARTEYKSYADYLKHGTASCPVCGQTMKNMGKGFRPPKQKDVKQWKALENVSQSKKRFPGWLW